MMEFDRERIELMRRRLMVLTRTALDAQLHHLECASPVEIVALAALQLQDMPPPPIPTIVRQVDTVTDTGGTEALYINGRFHSTQPATRPGHAGSITFAYHALARAVQNWPPTLDAALAIERTHCA